MQYKKYKGWTNYETWNAALWVDNDQWFTEEAQRLFDEAKGTADKRINDVTPYMAEIIEAQFDQGLEDQPVSGWIADAVNSYLGEVDWQEIAGHFMSEVDKSSAETEEEETE